MRDGLRRLLGPTEAANDELDDINDGGGPMTDEAKGLRDAVGVFDRAGPRRVWFLMAVMGAAPAAADFGRAVEGGIDEGVFDREGIDGVFDRAGACFWHVASSSSR
jgi:hypothetical protein